MTRLQKRARSADVYLPVSLQAGISSTSPRPSPPMYSINKPPSAPLSPFRKTHRRAVSSPRATQWPLISTSVHPSVPYPISPHHDASKCGSNCTRCNKRKLIQLNSPPSKNTPTTAAPLQPVPQAHLRAASDGLVDRFPKRLSITTTPAILAPGKPPCCQKCGKQKRPASASLSIPRRPVASPPAPQRPSMPMHHPPMSRKYQALRSDISGGTAGTPHPNHSVHSHPPSPPLPYRPASSGSGGGEHIISPLSPRRKVNFSLPGGAINPNPNPSKSSSSSAASQAYTPFSPSQQETVEIGTGRLINLISNAIRETSPPGTATAVSAVKYTRVHAHSRTSSVEANVGLGDSTDVSSDEDTRTARLNKSRSPVDAMNLFEPIELDGVEIGDATAEILDSYADSYAEERPLTNPGQKTEEVNTAAEWAEYGYDWTDAVSIPVIRLPSVKEGISRFRSLRGGGSQRSRPGVRTGPSVREKFGSMRSGGGEDQWYGGGAGRRYQALGSGVEIGFIE